MESSTAPFPHQPGLSLQIQMMIEHTPAAIAIFDRNMRYLMTSQRWLEDYGLGDRVLTGLSHYEVFPEIGDDWKAIHQDCLQGATHTCDEAIFPRANGRTDWIRWDVRPWQEPDGTIGGLIMFTEVLTARKQTEQALEAANQALIRANAALAAENQQRNAELKNFFSLSADMLCVVGFDGYFKRINPRFESVVGYTEAELLSMPFLSFVHPADQDAMISTAAALAQGSQVAAFENRYRCKDGSYRWLSWTSASDVNSQVIYAIARDVTAQKEADLAFKKQAKLLDQVQGAVVATDRAGTITYWSKGAERLYGYATEDAIGQHIRILYPQHLTAFLEESIIPPLQKSGFAEIETVNLSRSGHEIPVSLSLSLEKDVDDNTIGMIAYIVDIRDRKQAQLALEKERRFLKALLDNLSDGIVACDEKGMLTLFNKAARDFHGLPHAPLPPEQWSDHFDLYRADGQTPMNMDEIPLFRAFRGEIVRNSEMVIAPKVGQVRNLLASGQAFFNESGEKLGAVVAMRDISDRKRAEEQIINQAQREKLFNQFTNQIRTSLDFESILNTIVREIQAYLKVDRCHFAWYVESDSGAYWEVISEVQAAGLPSFIGQYPVEVFGPLSEVILNRQMLCINDSAKVEHVKVRQFLQDLGNQSMLVLPVQANFSRFGLIACIHHQAVRPWTEDELELLEAVVAQLAIALNQAELYRQTVNKAAELEQAMVELQRTQMQMVQAEKMSSLGQLVVGVAHEINNPVNFIYGNLNHAKEYTDDLLEVIRLYQAALPEPDAAFAAAIADFELEFLSEDLPKLLNSMKVGADRIRSIVSSLRTFSRMDEAEMKAADIHDGLDSTLMILQNRLKAHSHRPEIQVIKDYGTLPRVECYPGQLNQVFMNILSNGIDALEDACDRGQIDQPKLRIRTHLGPNCTVVIAIADNGLGMPEKIRQRVFDPFFTTKPVGKGTGMGLSISYQIIVDRHGGTLTCTSQAKQGTEFVISIPCCQG